MTEKRPSGTCTTRYQIQKLTRDLSHHDRHEVERFHEYLKDKVRLPADQFKTKWANYEAGKEQAQ